MKHLLDFQNIQKKAESLIVAPWTDQSSDMGPVISEEHKIKIEDYISKAVSYTHLTLPTILLV